MLHRLTLFIRPDQRPDQARTPGVDTNAVSVPVPVAAATASARIGDAAGAGRVGEHGTRLAGCGRTAASLGGAAHLSCFLASKGCNVMCLAFWDESELASSC